MANNPITKPIYNKSANSFSPIASRSTPSSSPDVMGEDFGTQTVPTAEYAASDLRADQPLTANQPGMPMDGQISSTQMNSRRQENRAGGKSGGLLPTNLTVPFIAAVVVVALVIDIAEIWVLGLLGFVTSPIAGLFFYYMFKRRGIDMKDRSRIIILIAGPLVNIVPGFSLIPGGWTVEVVALIASVYAQEKLERAGMGLPAKK